MKWRRFGFSDSAGDISHTPDKTLVFKGRINMLRGLEKVKGEWTLVCLSYNLKRLHRLKAS